LSRTVTVKEESAAPAVRARTNHRRAHPAARAVGIVTSLAETLVKRSQ
jgi:hypothetical protein